MTLATLIVPGATFNRLTFIKEDAPRIRLNGKRRRRALVRCDCGREFAVDLYKMTSGRTKGCGCLNGEKHGLRKTPEYNIWHNMMRRCSDPKNKSFKNYGGRGVKVCERWKGSFSTFLSDMGPRPPKTTLEREDVDGDYSPKNCRWALRIDQALNQRRTVRVTWGGAQMTIREVAKAENVSYRFLYRKYFAPGHAKGDISGCVDAAKRRGTAFHEDERASISKAQWESSLCGSKSGGT